MWTTNFTWRNNTSIWIDQTPNQTMFDFIKLNLEWRSTLKHAVLQVEIAVLRVLPTPSVWLRNIKAQGNNFTLKRFLAKSLIVLQKYKNKTITITRAKKLPANRRQTGDQSGNRQDGMSSLKMWSRTINLPFIRAVFSFQHLNLVLREFWRSKGHRFVIPRSMKLLLTINRTTGFVKRSGNPLCTGATSSNTSRVNKLWYIN